MFNRNTTNNDQVSTNTRAVCFTSDEAMLTVGYWNNNISLKLNPCVGKDTNGFNVYDKDKRVSTAIVAEKAMALIEGINNHIAPAIRKVAAGGVLDKPISVSVAMANDTGRISISYANDNQGIPSLYLVIYKNANDKGQYADQYGYKFNKTILSYNYDSATGMSETTNSEAEFSLFVEILKTAPSILGYVSHSIRYSNDISARFSAGRGNSSVNSFGGPSMGGYSAPQSSAPVMPAAEEVYDASGSDLPF